MRGNRTDDRKTSLYLTVLIKLSESVRSRFNGVRQGPKSREASRERKARPGDTMNLPHDRQLRKDFFKIFSRNQSSKIP